MKFIVYFLNHYYLKKDNNTIYTTIHMRISSSLFLYTSLLFSVCAIQIPEYSIPVEQHTYKKEYFSHSSNHCIAYHYAIKYDGRGSIYIAGTERDLTIHTHNKQCGNVSQGWKKVVAFDNRNVRYIIIKTFGYFNGIKCGGYLTMDTSFPKIHIFEKCHWGNGLDDKNTVHTPLITMKVIATKYEYKLNKNQQLRLRIHDLSNSTMVSVKKENKSSHGSNSNLHIRKPYYHNPTHIISVTSMASVSKSSATKVEHKTHVAPLTISTPTSAKVEHKTHVVAPPITSASTKVEHKTHVVAPLTTPASTKVEHKTHVVAPPTTPASTKVEHKTHVVAPLTTSTPASTKVEHKTHVASPLTTPASTSVSTKVEHKTHVAAPLTTPASTKVEHKTHVAAPLTTPASTNVEHKTHASPPTTSIPASTNVEPMDTKPLQTTMPQKSSPPTTVDETTAEFIKTFAGQWYLTAENMEFANNPRPCRTITIFENENKFFFKTAMNEGNQTFTVIDTLIDEYNHISRTFVMAGLKYTYHTFRFNNNNYLYLFDSKYEYLYTNINTYLPYEMTNLLRSFITKNKYNIILTDMSCYTD